MPNGELLLEFKGITKRFPGVTALDNVDFSIKSGEIRVLVGENGAGKTTLVQIISGALMPDKADHMKYDGKDISFSGPSDALKVGIGAVMQHFSLVPNMTVAENIFLNREILKKNKAIDHIRMNQEAAKLIEDLGVSINPNCLTKDLSPGDQQIVEICKVISLKPKLMIMDEPTSGLKNNEIKRLFEIIENLRKKGVTILYISHRLEEIFKIGESITVLRNGKRIADCPMKDLTHKKLTELIIGHALGKEFPKEKVPKGKVLLKTIDLCNDKTQVNIKNINLEVREGEILGIYGILGSGKEVVAQTIFGVKPATSGRTEVRGRECVIKNPKDAINNKIGYLTDDRSRDGLLMGMTVKQNQTIAALERFSIFDYIVQPKERKESEYFIQELNIKVPYIDFMAKNLSGGNQQKVVIAKWLISEASILMFNEPTKGIDIGAKVEVFRKMTEQAKKNVGILFISSELDEIIGMSDRIIVMRNGEISAEFESGEVTKDEVLKIATMHDEIEDN